MRKFILMAVCLCSIYSGFAQKNVGEVSFIPRVGLNLSNLGDMDILTTPDDNLWKSKSRPDFMLGADVEYQLLDPLSIGIGAYYSRQGCRWADYSVVGTDKDNHKVTDSFQDVSVLLQYINIPVSAKMYLSQGFAVHAGVQCGIALDSNWHTTLSTLTEISADDKKFESVTTDADILKMKSLVWSIPVGASFEYENVIIDACYNIPLSRFSGLISKGRNQVLTFSVGYRL